MEETGKKSGRRRSGAADATSAKPTPRKSVAAGRARTPRRTAAAAASTMNPLASGDPVRREEWIRVAAYYRAERRGFGPGRELEDWFAAEAALPAATAIL
jgi:hypothetical protein